MASQAQVSMTSTRHRSDTFASDKYQIDLDPRVLDVWEAAMNKQQFESITDIYVLQP